ncbi:hypothetical protein AQF52_8011 [Streptomyces venezuelae]|uniref:hypothetical protein n=1 Tax=Streptomyces gardneri TaxID=66892 RepID=UPI0006BD9774|nr:hypothetical protein [Streptomyces gardneri]ALO13592.1 hypothetical protein AQF52_8011 [Streptomyces venezuelae]QPK50185.1 hypothetical protein H4W23_40170 [Streptomyces gardneri]WRK41790.1 hypothetical protein U0M97_40420 [Streptomyces venezuelae]CUM35640.1 hypothetical protein BN2537_245 [Streptomyces venezuelae]
MTSSLDWAGLAPAIAAAVQTAAVVVQVYWDRRQRGALMTQHPVFGETVPARVEPMAHDFVSVRVRIGVEHAPSAAVSVIVHVAGADGADGKALPAAKEHGPW